VGRAARWASTAASRRLTDIALRFEIDSDADRPTERMIQTTERCVILQTLRNPPRITVG
jgi:hypothetical protein